jgi:hypothetical protein
VRTFSPDRFSILEPNVQIVPFYPLHLLAYLARRSNWTPLSSASLCKQWALVPMRALLASALAQLGFFPHNGQAFSGCFRPGLKQPARDDFFASFALVQQLSLDTPEKSDFLILIASICGLLLQDLSVSQTRSSFQELAFLHFVSCMLFNKAILDGDTTRVKLDWAKAMLIMGDLLPADIDAQWKGIPTNDPEFLGPLSEFAETAETVDETVFRMFDDSTWHPLLPFLKQFLVVELIRSFSVKYPRRIINFPPPIPGAELFLLSPVLFAVEFHVLAEVNPRRELHQYIFNLLIAAASIAKDREVITSGTLAADSLMGLASIFLKMSFRTFVHARIEYRHAPNMSIFLFLSQLGPVGREVLQRLNLPIGNGMLRRIPPPQKPTKEELARRRAKLVSDCCRTAAPLEDDIEFEELGGCQLCRDLDSDCLCHYPAVVYLSILPSVAKLPFLDRKDHCKALQLVRISAQCVHLQCWERAKRRPPLCDGCNALLPRIDIGFTQQADAERVQSMEVFLAKFDRNGRRASIEYLVQCFTAQIEIIELRLRSNPESFDAEMFSALLYNYYYCIWHMRREEAGFILDQDADASLSPMVHLILILLASDSSHCARFAKAMGDSLSASHAFEFLRRVAIFQHFALRMRITDRQPHNWDALLSPESLFQRYQVERKIVQSPLPLFSLWKLPEDFFGFLLQPFAIDIANNCELELGLCLLTGRQIVNPPPSVVIRDTQPMAEVLREHLAGTYSFFIILTGARAGRVVIGSSEFDWVSEAKACFLDSYGHDNREFRSGRMLTLSHVRVEMLTDLMLSGAWTDKLPRATVKPGPAPPPDPPPDEPAHPEGSHDN